MSVQHLQEQIEGFGSVQIMDPFEQRWASTLANRSNARHRSNIRAPPRPLPPDVSIQSVEICVAKGEGSDSQLAGVSGLHIFAPAPHAPPPKGIGQRSKVVILPTTAFEGYLYHKHLHLADEDDAASLLSNDVHLCSPIVIFQEAVADDYTFLSAS